MDTQNVHSLCNFRRERMFEKYWDFYNAMPIPLLEQVILDYIAEISVTSNPSEKLLIEGIALFDFVSTRTDNARLSELAKARAVDLADKLKKLLDLG